MVSKRGSSGFKTVAGIVLVVIILLIMLNVIKIVPSSFKSITSCTDRGGSCYQGGSGYQCPDNYYREFGAKCSKDQGETAICCVPQSRVSDKLKDMTDEERAAVLNAIFVALDGGKALKSEIAMKTDQEYNIKIRLNDDLPAKRVNHIAIFATSSKEPGKRYYFTGKQSSTDKTITGELKLVTDEPKGTIGSFYKNRELFEGEFATVSTSTSGGKSKTNNVAPGYTLSIPYTPSLQDAYKDFTLHIILFDEEEMSAPVKEVNNESKDIRKMYVESKIDLFVAEQPKYVLAKKSIPMTITNPLKIEGVSTNWVAKDEVTITCQDMICDSVGLTLVKTADSKSKFDDLVEACKTTPDSGFQSKVGNIVGTTLETTGIPLNIDIGGFRLPTQKEKLLYIVQEKPITLIKGKQAKVMIDKAAMKQSFYKNYKAGTKGESSAEQLMIGERTYVCARAMKGEEKYFALSETPLKVDILSPFVTNDMIQIKYPDPKINDPTKNDYGNMYPSIRNYDYFYDSYPNIVVQSCQDYGQSGCSKYDYYIKTDDFINLKMNGPMNVSDAFESLALQEGLNLLFNAVSTLDPLNTVCPFITSNNYRRNSQPEIRFQETGQGLVCIRVEDKVGNSIIVWKQLWTPEAMAERIAKEAIVMALAKEAEDKANDYEEEQLAEQQQTGYER